MRIGLNKTGGGGAGVEAVTLQAGMDTQVALSVDHPASIKSLTLVSHGYLTLDLSAMTSLKTFLEDNGGGGFLNAFPILPASLESFQIRGCGPYFASVDASALIHLTNLDCSQAGQIGYNAGAIMLPNSHTLTRVAFGACNLLTAAIDSLLASVVANAAVGCSVFVDGPGSDPSPGDRSTTGAVNGSDWVMTPDGTLGRYWVLAGGETTYYLYLHPTGVWVIASTLTLDTSTDPYWSGPSYTVHSIGTYTAVNQTADDIAVDFDSGPSGMKSIYAIIAGGGSVTYNNMGFLPW